MCIGKQIIYDKNQNYHKIYINLNATSRKQKMKSNAHF